MSFKDFVKVCHNFAQKANIDDAIVFHEDTETGKYIALFSSGIRMYSNSSSNGITVRWGAGHQAMVNAMA